MATAGTTAAGRMVLTRREARMIAEELWKLMEKDREPKAEEEWLTLDEAARYVRRSKWTLYHKIDRLPHEKRDGRLMFTKAGLSAWGRRE